jgi:hypothetical protein
MSPQTLGLSASSARPQPDGRARPRRVVSSRLRARVDLARRAAALLFGFGIGCSVDAASPADAAPAAQRSAPARLLFKSGFEGDIVLGAPVLEGRSAWQDISGADRETGHAWPPKLWGGHGRFQLIPGERERIKSPAELRDYMYNEIQTVAGRDGKPTRALYSAVLKSVHGKRKNYDATQNVFHLLPASGPQGDLYVAYWLKLQPDLLERMTEEKWAGRVISDWKTGGDYRILLSVFGDRRDQRLYWNLKGDNVANGGLPPRIFWELNNDSVPVPVDKWFRIEIFVHRSDDIDGRVWIAVDGHKLFDPYGPNLGILKLPWNRVMIFLNYSTGQALPAYQWVDDVEIWDGFPPHASAH